MRICCDICGGELAMLPGGQAAACKSCGMEHTIARVREMLGVQKKPSDEMPVIHQQLETATTDSSHMTGVAALKEREACTGVSFSADDAAAAPQIVLTESKESDFVLKKRFGGSKLVRYTGNAQRVIIPASVEEIPDPDMFAGHDEIVELVFPGGLSTPYAACFANCRNLKKVTIMGSAVMMDETFAGCSSLETVEIKDVESPDAPIILGDRAFMNCTALTSFYVDPNVEMEMGERCFENCISLPEFRCTQFTGMFTGERSIPKGCFRNCRNLQEVVVSDDLDCIEEAAFENCIALRSVTYHNGAVPTGVKICPGAFQNAGWNP